LIQEKLNENKNLNEKCTKGDEKILLLNKKIQDKEKENKSLSEEVEKIKKSPEYIENINKISSVESGEKEIEKEISELRQLIDFKALSNFFHIFEDRMTIVKLYRDNFIEEFKKDKGSRLLNLLNESKLNTETIYDKIKKIQDRGEEIENDKKEIKKDETHPLALEIERAKEEISNIINEKEWAEKNKEKIKSQVDENIIAVKEQLGFMKLNLED
jgi:hypothetical protein